MSEFNDLLARVQALTGLGTRQAAQVAFEFEEGSQPLPQEIVDKAIALGFDVERKHGKTKAGVGPEITTDPAEVLSEIYMTCPRVFCSNMPKLGRAPSEALAHPEIASVLDGLPEEIRAMLVKIDMLEGAATFWIRDEANDIDRPIGPIDITRYTSENALEAAFRTLMGRLDRVLAADFN